MFNRKIVELISIPASEHELEQVRLRCRSLVQRRAAVSASISALPIPGLDVVSDLRLFSELIEEVNRAFGLTPEQIGRLQPRFRLLAYQAAVNLGGTMVGKYVTREVVLRLLQRAGAGLVAKQATRFVPLAGQAAAAAIGFFAFRQIGYQHVEACARVAQEVMRAQRQAAP